MGQSSKFSFSLPGRKQKTQKQHPAPPPPISAPLTKVQKILGTAGINTDSTGVPVDSIRLWEAQSNPGNSVPTPDSGSGEADYGTTTDHGWAHSNTQREGPWEDESAIIPSVLNRPGNAVAGSATPGAVTDASSLRRRQSSSTITSYYDKSKLPLSISQQTSNSAMAKGLPSKAHALLDIDGEFNNNKPPPQLKKPRKKPSRLDITSLLPLHRSQKSDRSEFQKVQVLGPDLLTIPPSSSSASPAPTPPPISQRVDRKLGHKLTRESLRSRPDSSNRPGSGGRQAQKANVVSHDLYSDDEQKVFANPTGQDFQEGPGRRPDMLPDGQVLGYRHSTASSNSGRGFLSPFPPTTSRAGHPSKQLQPAGNHTEAKLAASGVPPSPGSVTPADCASVSSRHTRTSKASKRTDRSLTDIDLLQNSVLALSSDSEDDYESSSKDSLAVPTFSDGRTSPASPRSAMSRRNSADPSDNRGKSVKRASFATSPQFIPNSQTPGAIAAPKIGPRSSSLAGKSTAKRPQALADEMSRLSIGTASTGPTAVQEPTQSPGSQHTRASKKGSKQPSDTQFDFPAPPVQRVSRPTSVSRAAEQTPSPSSLDIFLQTQLSPGTHDNRSNHNGTSPGSPIVEGRRGSATSSIHDGSSGRFMAVTRQEEMLLAALRMKRARMREDIIAEFEGEMDREGNALRRQLTNDSTSTTGGISRQSSRSTMRQEGTLSARPRQRSLNGEKEKREQRQNPPMVDSQMYATNAGGILDFDEPLTLVVPGDIERPGDKGRQRASLSATTTPGPRRPSIPRRASDQVNPKGQKDHPQQILEDPAEDDEDGVPRPDSPVSPSDFPAPVSIKNNKQVRLSAVGFYKEGPW
ncbi:hypothetical protein VTK26DRAFT_6021 [Humicola hyalothermophila]